MHAKLLIISCFLGLNFLPIALVAADVVVQPVKQDRIRKSDFIKFHPIYGAMSGESFFLHYCLPEFIPRGEGDCRAGIPGSVPDTVQVKYQYSLGEDFERPLLEGGGWFVFPFPVNADVEGKTPYVDFYRERERDSQAKSENSYVKKVPSGGVGFEGLSQYKSANMPKTFRWWVPENKDEYRTRLGNPPIFSCSPQYCNLTLDLGNGWEARTTFNEAALSDWRKFFVRFKTSTRDVMEKYYGI